MLSAIVLITAFGFSGENLPYPGQPDIFLEIHESSSNRSNLYFFAPHENEHVVNQYLIEKIAVEGGRFVILRQVGARNLALKFGTDQVLIDPNRIFSKAGVIASLLDLNPSLSPDSLLFKQAQRRAVRLGKFICRKLGRVNGSDIVVAIHNNTDGYDDDGKDGVGTISIHRYQKKFDGGALYIKDLHIGKGDEDDLFFITDPLDFEKMKADNWNVLLQHPQVAVIEDEDDGSLSVLSEKRGVRYINIEAQRKEGDDHLEVQKEMVDYVFELVKGR